jgi:hypothetical protein
MTAFFAALSSIGAAPATPPPPVIRIPTVQTKKPVPRPMLTPSLALRRGMVKLTPQEAVMKAAEAAPRGIYGVFELEVRRAEQVGPNFFLNSELDYRDPRNLSVAIGPKAQAELRKAHGDDLGKGLKGKKLQILGYARRVRVDFTSNGRPSGKYYYQTHVPIGDARQIGLAN